MPAPDLSQTVAGTCLMTAIKDEGPDLLEWVAWHRLLGFDRILVWSNDCSDGCDLMLDRLAQMGWVDHMRHSPAPDLSAQDNVARLAQSHPGWQSADWVMWLDADEFLTVNCGGNRLSDLISALKGAAGIAVNWRVFGSMGRHHTAQDHLVTETFTQAAPLEDEFSRVVKTLYRKTLDITDIGIHRPMWREGSAPRVLSGAGKPVNDRFLFSKKKNGRQRDMLGNGQQSWALAQVNHYAIKALDRLALKRARGNGLEPGATPDRFGADYLGWFDRNEVTDTQLAPHLPALRALINSALQDPELAQAYGATRAAQAQRLSGLQTWIDHLAAVQSGIAAKVAP